MPHLIGQMILQYKIVEKLGEGGMGVVYQAEDTKLRRTVALKFLPHDIESHESERARFLQEAQAAAILNHPNICTVYDIQEYEGEQFIVMEYVDGKTLRQMVPIQKLQTAIDYAVQLGEALQEAHSKGIVHRDIKTDNIMVNAKNQIKVMDFGLAKLGGSLKLTKSRSTVGTLAYMAPEQIQGTQADARSDIFSFGVVLYEMLTGQLPFKGEHEAGMMYSILNQEPEPLESHLPNAPSELLHVLNRSLEKVPEERYQSAQDMVIDLRRLKKETSGIVREPSISQPPSWRQEGSGLRARPTALPDVLNAKKKRIRRYLGAALLVVAAVVIYLVLPKSPLKIGSLSRRQLTFTGNVILTDISPDGKSFAYVDDSFRVYVQDIAGGAPLEVFKGTEIMTVRWAPGGTELAVAGELESLLGTYVMPRLGGAHRKYEWIGPWLSWSPDGSKLVLSNVLSTGPLYLLNILTQDTARIGTALGHYWNDGIDWSPAGHLIAVETRDGSFLHRRILTISSDGKRSFVIVDDSSDVASELSPPARWNSRGDGIYYVSGVLPNRDLMKMDIDPYEGKPKGSPRRIHSGLSLDALSLSKDNKRLVGSWRQIHSTLYSGTYGGIGPEKKVIGKRITEGSAVISNAKISPDGKSIAFSRSGQLGCDLYVLPYDGGEPRQITFGERISEEIDSQSIAWDIDGTHVAYVSSRSGSWRVNVASMKGGGARVVGRRPVSFDAHITWAPGRSILVQVPSNRNFLVLNTDSGEERELVQNDSVGFMFSPSYSPDGERVAVTWNRHPNPGLWILSTQDSAQHFLSSSADGPLIWSADGKNLLLRNSTNGAKETFFSNTASIISITSGKISRFLAVQDAKAHVQDLTLTENKVVWTVVESQSDAWLFENFDPEVE